VSSLPPPPRLVQASALVGLFQNIADEASTLMTNRSDETFNISLARFIDLVPHHGNTVPFESILISPYKNSVKSSDHVRVSKDDSTPRRSDRIRKFS
jgi:hypothetical protein